MTKGECRSLALRDCVACDGGGIVGTRQYKKLRPCDCVFRRIFRGCVECYRRCMPESVIYQNHRHTYSWPGLEYRADFELIARQVLAPGDLQVFRLHALADMPWPECTRRLGLSKGNFFHRVYRIERIVGLAAIDTRPCPLYPPSRYFRAVRRSIVVPQSAIRPAAD